MRVYSFWAGWTSAATVAPGPNSGEAAPCWGDGEKVFGNIFIMVLMDGLNPIREIYPEINSEIPRKIEC